MPSLVGSEMCIRDSLRIIFACFFRNNLGCANLRKVAMRLCLGMCTESSDTPMTASSPHCAAAAAAAAAAVTSSVTSDRRHSSISAVSCSNSSSARQHAPPSSSERLAVADGPSCLCLVFVLSQQIVILWAYYNCDTSTIRVRFDYDSATTRYEVFRALAYEIVYENQW